MTYEFFYGTEGEQFSFYRIPKLLFLAPEFRQISVEAKVLYENLLKDNISYEYLLEDYPKDHDILEEILALMVDTVCSSAETIRIAGDSKPAEVVRSAFLKLTDEHIRYVLDCLRENTTRIRDMKHYLLATLYNAGMTISTYYDARVRHDLSIG